MTTTSDKRFPSVSVRENILSLASAHLASRIRKTG
jgi:hypothetical protein